MCESRDSTAAECRDEGRRADGEEKQGAAMEIIKGVQSGQGSVPDRVHQAMKMEVLPCDKTLQSGYGVKMTNEVFALKCVLEDNKQ